MFLVVHHPVITQLWPVNFIPLQVTWHMVYFSDIFSLSLFPDILEVGSVTTDSGCFSNQTSFQSFPLLDLELEGGYKNINENSLKNKR